MVASPEIVDVVLPPDVARDSAVSDRDATSNFAIGVVVVCGAGLHERAADSLLRTLASVVSHRHRGSSSNDCDRRSINDHAYWLEELNRLVYDLDVNYVGKGNCLWVKSHEDPFEDFKLIIEPITTLWGAF